MQNRNRGVRGREGTGSPRLSPDPEASGLPKAGWIGAALWREGTPGIADQRGLGRERRQRVLIPRLLSGDHPSAPPGTLGPDCPPPAGVSPDRISERRGRAAAPPRGGDLRRPGAALGRSPLPAPALASKGAEGGAASGEGRGRKPHPRGPGEGAGGVRGGPARSRKRNTCEGGNRSKWAGVGWGALNRGCGEPGCLGEKGSGAEEKRDARGENLADTEESNQTGWREP